jgi:precorrin-2 dehydrogenase/sirohydrochlorin ferrochelatase
VSGYPIVLNGNAIVALIVGGGRVAERRAGTLLACGASVRVVALSVSAPLRESARDCDRCTIVEREYRPGDVSGVTLVFAATDRPDVNATVAADARRAGIPVNMAGDPHNGDFVTPALHSTGDLVIAVTAGGVPGAAARIRDALAQRFDSRYAIVLARLRELRSSLIGAGRRPEWQRASGALLDGDFCARVESGTLESELAKWR